MTTAADAARLAELRAEALTLLAAGLPLWPAQVAALFRVDPKTVTRWAKAGKLATFRTAGGHRRYRAASVRALLDEGAAAA